MRQQHCSTCRVKVLLASILALSSALWAQSPHGAITGVVKDASGALVPGASLTITNEATGSATEVKTQANGLYLAPQLLPGNYSVSVSFPGFRSMTISGLKVDVAATLTQDLALEVGDVAQRLEVSGESSLVNTTSGQVGMTIQLSHVLEMPFADRNVFNLVNLVPGSFFQSGGDNPSDAFLANVSLGGARTRETMAALDGVNNSRGGLDIQNIEMAPPVDAMQEFNVTVNNMSAEYGRSIGGTVNAVTKSGTNVMHGSLYDYLRNEKLDALGWGNDRTPPLKRNNFGGSLGGPIRKNRTFFFYNYDAIRMVTATTVTRNVGLPEWRSGNFTTAMRDAGGRAALVPIYDPDTGTGTFGSPLGTLQFPNNVIPASRLDPVSVKVLGYMPQANRPANNSFNQSGNWQTNLKNPITRDYHTVRLDQEISSQTKLFVRYIVTQPERNSTEYASDWGPADPNGRVLTNRRQNLAVNLTRLFSPGFFGELVAGFMRYKVANAQGGCCDQNFGQILGIRNLGRSEVFPRFSMSGGLAPVNVMGAGGDANRRAVGTNIDLIANFTRLSSSHTRKFGGQYSRFYHRAEYRFRPSGDFGFDGHFTRGVTAAGAAVPNTGIILADVLLGRINSVILDIAPQRDLRSDYYAGYFQEDWRATSRLTLNFGVRYETQTPDWEREDIRSNFNPYIVNPLAGQGDIPAGALGAVEFQNRAGAGKYLYRWDKNNFSPRFGFAYRVFGTNDTVIRGGYGLYFGRPFENTTEVGGLGFGQVYSVGNPIPYRLRDGLPASATAAVSESVRTSAFGTRGTAFEQSRFVYIDPDLRYQTSQNFNLTLQHQWRGTLIEAGYMGNLGRHLVGYRYNINQIPPSLLSRTEIPERLRRPFTILASNQGRIVPVPPGDGVGSYHAFHLKVERRFRGGAGWVASYTLSKAIDNFVILGEPWGDNDVPQNIYDMRSEKSLSTNHIPHRLVLSPIYELPFGRGRRWLHSGRILSAVLGGWQVSTLATIQSGSPFGVQVLNGARDILGDALAALRPDLVGNPNSPNQGQPAAGVRGLQWLDPAAFAIPARFTHGNAARTLPGVLRPGLVNFDSVLAKSFVWRERWRAQFRWEMFDTFNTPYFGLPGDTLRGGNFGIITSASRRRIMQLGLRLTW